MIVDAAEFLAGHAETWTARQATNFTVVNVHAAEVGAPPEAIFAALADHCLLAPGARWRFLFALRGALGCLFRWDAGLRWHAPQPLAPGNYYAFFRIEYVVAPGMVGDGAGEIGLSVDNQLTGALMSWVLRPQDPGTRVYNITCANFPTLQGKAYWKIIRSFHNALIEDSLASLRRRFPAR